MRDNLYSARPLARWYWIAAVASLLFMLLGVWGEVMTEVTDPAALPIDQRVMVEARPVWMIVAYGVAVWSGLLGAVMLVFRRKLAQPLMLVSLLLLVYIVIWDWKRSQVGVALLSALG